MIIAEIGLNHLGSSTLADIYVDRLLSTDVDAITFQIREQDYYTNGKEKYLLSDEKYTNLVDRVHASGKQFGIALANISKLQFFESINIDFYKIIRNDILNQNLVSNLISTNKKLIVSTGTCSENEVANFIVKYNNENITINHTQLSYDIADCNLSAINTLKEKFKVKVSYGSHCSNSKVLYMALAFNPTDLLFYVKADSFTSWPDSKHALTLQEVNAVVSNLKELKCAIGTGTKKRMEIKI